MLPENSINERAKFVGPFERSLKSKFYTFWRLVSFLTLYWKLWQTDQPTNLSINQQTDTRVHREFTFRRSASKLISAIQTKLSVEVASRLKNKNNFCVSFTAGPSSFEGREAWRKILSYRDERQWMKIYKKGYKIICIAFFPQSTLSASHTIPF